MFNNSMSTTFTLDFHFACIQGLTCVLFQPNQDGGKTPFTTEKKFPPPVGLKSETTTSGDQSSTYTELPRLCPRKSN